MDAEQRNAGCAMGLTCLGSLAVGVYHGLADSKNMPRDPGIERILIYGPSIVGGITGAIFSKEMYKNNPQAEEKINQLPLEQRASARGCGATMGGVILMGALNGIGYAFGHYVLGKVA